MGNKYTVPLNVGAIRESCFRPADKWTPPTGEELRYLLENVLNLSQEGLARHVGVTGRTVRRWVNGESDIAYSGNSSAKHRRANVLPERIGYTKEI